MNDMDIDNHFLKKKLKVLYIADCCERYGATESMLQMISCLNDKGYIDPVIAVSNKDRLYNWSKKNGYEVIVTGHKAFLYDLGTTFLSCVFNLFYLPKRILEYKNGNEKAINILDNYLKTNKIDIIHTNVNRNDIGILLAKKYNIPHIFHIREFPPGDHFNLLTFNKNYIDEINNGSDLIVAISKSVAKSWIKRGIDKSKIVDIWDGIVESTKKRKQAILTNDDIRFVMMGAICKEKGFFQLIKAISIMPASIKKKIHLDIYGNGMIYMHFLKFFCKIKGLDKIIKFKGYKENVSEVLIDYDIGVVCSKKEGLGRATVEYMNSGCLVIASNTGANSEIICDNVTGLLYKYGDHCDLKNHILSIFQNRKKYRLIAEKGKVFSETYFQIQEYGEKIYRLYNDIL